MGIRDRSEAPFAPSRKRGPLAWEIRVDSGIWPINNRPRVANSCQPAPHGFYADKSFAKFNGARPAVESGIVDRSADPGVTPPQIIRKVEPEYSEEARKAKFQGRVLLSVDIDGSGQVTTVTVIHRVGLGLDEKAAEAVRQWKFKPAMKDGKPVAVQTEVEMDFRLL